MPPATNSLNTGLRGVQAGRFTHKRGLRSGATLVELLVVVVIVFVVGGAALTLYQLAVRHSIQQEAVIEQTQNLRAALYTVARDVRMAGNGLRFIGNQTVQISVPSGAADPNIQDTSRNDGWFAYRDSNAVGVRPIFGRNGEATGPDTLTLFRADIESSIPLGRLAQDYMPGTDSTIVIDEKIPTGYLKSGDMLVVTQGENSVIIQTGAINQNTSEITIGERYKPADALPGGLSLQSGSKVFNLRDVIFVTYYVDTTNNRLMATYFDGTISDDDLDDISRKSIIVANNIEDFQVGYFLNPDGSGTAEPLRYEIDENTLAGRWVAGVRLSLVAVSSVVSEASGQGAPVKVMDHTTVGQADGRSRRILSENINLRNY